MTDGRERLLASCLCRVLQLGCCVSRWLWLRLLRGTDIVHVSVAKVIVLHNCCWCATGQGVTVLLPLHCYRLCTWLPQCTLMLLMTRTHATAALHADVTNAITSRCWSLLGWNYFFIMLLLLSHIPATMHVDLTATGASWCCHHWRYRTVADASRPAITHSAASLAVTSLGCHNASWIYR